MSGNAKLAWSSCREQDQLLTGLLNAGCLPILLTPSPVGLRIKAGGDPVGVFPAVDNVVALKVLRAGGEGCRYFKVQLGRGRLENRTEAAVVSRIRCLKGLLRWNLQALWD